MSSTLPLDSTVTVGYQRGALMAGSARQGVGARGIEGAQVVDAHPVVARAGPERIVVAPRHQQLPIGQEGVPGAERVVPGAARRAWTARWWGSIRRRFPAGPSRAASPVVGSRLVCIPMIPQHHCRPQCPWMRLPSSS